MALNNYISRIANMTKHLKFVKNYFSLQFMTCQNPFRATKNPFKHIKSGASMVRENKCRNIWYLNTHRN